MGDKEIDIDALREEHIENVKAGVNDEVHIFYMNGIPSTSSNLRGQLLSGDKEVEDNADDEERSRMVTMAKVISKVYRNAEAGIRPDSEMNLRGNTELRKQIINRELFKDVGDKNIDGYEFEPTDTDLIGLFVNEEKQEVIMGMRGLMVGRDVLDTRQFPDMVKSRFTETERAEGFGYQYRKDREIAKKVYNEVKEKYPNYKVIPSGHSRAGRLALFLGRKHNLDEYHAFAPVSNRGDIIDSVPRKGGRIYYHPRDPTSTLLHEQQGKTNEQHFEVLHDGFDPHQLGGFVGKTRIFKHPRKKEPFVEDIRFPPQDVSPEDLVDSDMGTGEFGSTNLDFILLNRTKGDMSLPTAKPTFQFSRGTSLPLEKKFIPVNVFGSTDLDFVVENTITPTGLLTRPSPPTKPTANAVIIPPKPFTGLVPYFGLREETPEPIFKSQPIYFDSLDPDKENTNALNKDSPNERTIFNEYIPSVFTDLNLRPVKKFEPITFEEIDSDKNNKISLKELNDYLSKRGYDQGTIKDLFETFDTDNNGSISRREFIDLRQMV